MQADLVAQAQQAIRLHLLAHPMAADTDSGIHQWWVSWVVPPPLSVTQTALQRLQAVGLVQCHYGLWRGVGERPVKRPAGSGVGFA